ncbi:unnamed protein product [Withania somnifera]
MADQQALDGSSTTNDSGGSSETIVALNIKTLDSQTYAFNVDKNLQVSALKDKLASQIGVPVEQQRLIFRGKVLKDNHLLSEYHVENGDTLHLVLRQSQSQPISGSSTGEAMTNNFNRGPEPQPTAGGSRNRIGQISHSVVLGTFNVGDQGEGLAVPDLSRVIGAVLNTVGIGNMTGGQLPGVQVSAPVPRPQANESLSQSGSQQSGQSFPGQSLPQVVQIPLGAAIAVPSINMPLPDSLVTLAEFMDRMELVFSQNGFLSNLSPNNAADPPAVQLPTNPRGLLDPEALSFALRQAERLFGGQVIAALSHLAGRLEREGESSDPALRGQVQTESVLIGQAMQHLGALLLELGRTILTLRMGQSPAESSVNAGPAVYISPTGPNPIMVQPFPLQTSSLFGGSAAVPLTLAPLALLGLVMPQGMSIFIYMQNQGQSSEMSHSKPEASASAGGTQSSGQNLGSPDESSSVPLGLGLGGLQPKRRTKQSIPRGNDADGSTSNNPNELPRTDGQQVFQSLAALAARGNEAAMPSGTLSDRGVMGTIGTGNRNVDGQTEIADAMSSVLQSPALNGLLSGVSQQTGAGSPDLLRNMMQQLTQSPAMMNSVNQIAQQIDTQDLGSMFSGQGGGMDLSRMFQQMMPIVSQALGGISPAPQQFPSIEQGPAENAAIDLHEVAQGIKNNSPPAEILRSLVQSTESYYHNGSTDQSLVDELCNSEDLTNEFMQMLRNDVSRRFQDKQGQ